MSKNKVTFKMPPLGKQHAKQAINKGVAKVENPVTRDQATQEITQLIQQSGIPPKMFVKIGQLCEAAINDKKQYSKLVDFMVKEKLETRESMKKPNLQLMASMVVIGKVAETLPDKMDQILPKGSVSEPVAPTQLEGL